DFDVGAFWVGAFCGPSRGRGLGHYVRNDTLRFSGLDYRRSGSADRHFDPDASKRSGRSGPSVLVHLLSRACNFPASLESFPVGARYRTAVQAEVKIDKTAIIGAGSWGTALAWLWGKDGRQISRSEERRVGRECGVWW